MRDLPDFLKPGDVLVVNDTKVIPARLRGHRGIAKIEVLLMEPVAEPGQWKALARPAKKLKPGDRIDFAPDFTATVAARGDAGEITLAFDRSARS